MASPSDAQTNSLTFKGEIGPDGKLGLVPYENGKPREPVQTKDFSPVGGLDEWYVARDPAGKVLAVSGTYTGGPVPVGIIERAPAGTELIKTDSGGVVDYLASAGANAFAGDLSQLVTDALGQMVVKAQEQVCGWTFKPQTFSMKATISVSLGLGGELEFSTDWETEKLCAAL